MNWKNFKIIASFLIVFALNACGEEPCVRECDSKGENCTRECGAGNCVDADDWGFPKLYVSAEQKDLNVTAEPILNQYAEAIDSGQILLDANNIPLVIAIGKRDQWTSWYGGEINPMGPDGNPDVNGFDGGLSVENRECLYYLPDGRASASGETSTITTSIFAADLSPTALKQAKGVAKPATNPIMKYDNPDKYADSVVPCFFRYGMGLYVGLAPDNSSHSSPNDVVLTYHIPDSKRPDYAYDNLTGTEAEKLAAQARDGYLVNGNPSTELPGAQTGDRLYFKIVDSTYIDNSGGYTVKIKGGTRSSNPGPLEKISGVFVDPMMMVMNRLYNGIVQNSTFINAVRAALALYIVFYGFTFMIGGVGEAKKEALTKVIKMGIVIALISPGSFDFFYNHLFRAFFEGTQSIAGLLMNPFGDYDPNSPWYSMDQVFAKLWSPETWGKIFSTLLSNALGFLFVPAMFLAVGLFMFAAIRALVVYLLAIFGMAILVVVAPIFIVFMLFGKTADLAKEWFDQMLVFALQQIILFAALGLFSGIIVMFLEKTIGYNVCWNIWSHFGFSNFHIFDFKFWMPDISTDQASLLIDSNGDGFKEWVTRYVDMPYFDLINDKAQIAKYLSEKNFISFSDVLVLIASIFLMHNFMKLVPTIATTLKGGAAGQSMDIFGAGGKLAGSLAGAGVEAFSGIVNAKNYVTSGARNLAANQQARYLGAKVKRGGVVGAGKVMDAAANSGLGQAVSSVKNNMSNNLAKKGEGLDKAVGRGLDKLSPSRIKDRAVMAQGQVAELLRHKGQSKAAQGNLSAASEASLMNGLNKGLKTFSSAAEMKGLSNKDKLSAAMPVFAALSNENFAGKALEKIAGDPNLNLSQIRKDLNEQFKNNPQAFSEKNSQSIQANLDLLEKAVAPKAVVDPKVVSVEKASSEKLRASNERGKAEGRKDIQGPDSSKLDAAKEKDIQEKLDKEKNALELEVNQRAEKVDREAKAIAEAAIKKRDEERINKEKEADKRKALNNFEEELAILQREYDSAPEADKPAIAVRLSDKKKQKPKE